MRFAGLEAAVAAGASLEEILRWLEGEYPTWFMADIISWHNLHTMVRMHEQDAVRPRKK